jgi:4a-hydroxytetrahydrobiopterin dehydratase
MTNLKCDINNSKCVPCEGGIKKNSLKTNQILMKQLHADWQFNITKDQLQRSYKFKNFSKTMLFINAVAHIADQQFHHPDIEFGYNYCKINYSTHAVDGLTDNDFICAALIDKLL